MPEKIDGYLTCWVTVREDGTLGIILPDADAMPERFRDRLKEVATKVEGVNSVDPSQTRLPEAWASLPAYLLTAGTAMQLVEQHRGMDQ